MIQDNRSRAKLPFQAYATFARRPRTNDNLKIFRERCNIIIESTQIAFRTNVHNVHTLFHRKF